MKVGLSFDLRNRPSDPRPWKEVWEDNLWLACRAEELGFDSLWLNEHFFLEDGYGPSMPVFLTALIERTKTVRVGSYVYVLPLHHPAQLAQETAVLDHLSGGRLDVGVGLGHRMAEYIAFGQDPKQRASRMEESLDVLLKAWTGEPFTHHGRYFNLENLQVQPAPLQQPHPPLWIASTAPKSAARAGRYGANLAGASAEPEVYKAYQQGLEESGFDLASRRVSAFWSITVTYDDPEEVWARNRDAYVERWAFYSKVREEMGDPPLEYGLDAGEPYREFDIIGSPDAVLSTLESMLANIPVTDLMIFAPAAGIPFRTEGMESLQLFAEEVIPELNSW